jgi:hypothetical protein
MPLLYQIYMPKLCISPHGPAENALFRFSTRLHTMEAEKRFLVRHFKRFVGFSRGAGVPVYLFARSLRSGLLCSNAMAFSRFRIRFRGAAGVSE